MLPLRTGVCYLSSWVAAHTRSSSDGAILGCMFEVLPCVPVDAWTWFEHACMLACANMLVRTFAAIVGHAKTCSASCFVVGILDTVKSASV